MTMNIYSGKDAYINGVSCISSWQATDAETAARFSASCAPGATMVGPPVANWTGQAAGFGPFPEAVLPGTVISSFQGVVNNTAGEGALLSLEGSIIVEQLTIDFNKETNAPISWQATFGFNGTPTEAAAGAADAASSNLYYAKGMDIKMLTVPSGGSPATIASTNLKIRTAQLVLRTPLTAFVDAGTTYRKPGNLEVDFSMSIYNPSLKTTILAPGNVNRVQIVLQDASMWDIGWMRMLGKNSYQVQTGTPNIIGYTQTAQWTANDGSLTGTGLGFVSYLSNLSGSEGYTDVYGTNPDE